jgi:hypothetical protein
LEGGGGRRVFNQLENTRMRVVHHRLSTTVMMRTATKRKSKSGKGTTTKSLRAKSVAASLAEACPIRKI